MAELSSSNSLYYTFTDEEDEGEEEEDDDIDPAPARNSFLPLRRFTVDHNPNAPRYIKSDSFEDLLV